MTSVMLYFGNYNLVYIMHLFKTCNVIIMKLIKVFSKLQCNKCKMAVNSTRKNNSDQND